MQFDVNALQWTRAPKDYKISPDKIEITTNPKTDLWQRTYYHFRNDNAPVLQMTTAEKFFSFVVKTDFSESHHRFDQCGVVLYLDSENWLKASVEYENETFQHLGSVVTNQGYSDWATTEIPAAVKTMWYRLSRREDDFCVECSQDGKVFHQMRICHLSKAQGGNPVRHLRLQPGGFLFLRGVHANGADGMQMARARRTGAGCGFIRKSQ